MYWIKKDTLETMEMAYPDCSILRKILNRVEDCKTYQTSMICYPLLMLDQHVLNMVRQFCGPVRLIISILMFNFIVSQCLKS